MHACTSHSEQKGEKLALSPWNATLGYHKTRAYLMHETPQWETADAEIKVPSGENTELKRSPFKA